MLRSKYSPFFHALPQRSTPLHLNNMMIIVITDSNAYE